MSVVQDGWKHQFITVNEVRLHYVTQGEGPLMLLLHGFPEFWYSWRHQIPAFAQNYKVVALDLRGYNESDKPQSVDSYTMPTLLRDVEGVIQGLGYDRCVLVGHDWGGAIAWCFAYEFPTRVNQLIVMNIPHPVKFAQALRSNFQQLLRSWYIFLFQLPMIAEWALSGNDYQAIATILEGMAVDKNTFSNTDITAYKNAAAKRGALTAMLNYYRNIFNQGILSQSKRWEVLSVPTLMIWGENDTALGKELTYGTESYVNDFHLRYIPDCSHWVQQEKAELVNSLMRDFLGQYSIHS